MKRYTLWFGWLAAWFMLGTAPAAEEPAKPLPEISWDKAPEHINEECVVVGRVVLTKNIGTMCFLNFHTDYKKHFVVVIKRNSFDRFPGPPENLYANQYVKVTGKIVEYQGQPEIIITGPDQIQIVDEAHVPQEAPTTQPGPDTPAPQPKTPTPTPPPQPTTPTTLPAGAGPAPTSPAGKAEARPFDGTVTVASFNVLNLFDDYDDPYHPDEDTPPKPEEELVKLAATIRKVNADVLALQEVENRSYLEQFNKTLLADLGYEQVVLFEGNDERGIDVAVLSRWPVGPVTSYRHVSYRNPDGRAAHFRRDLLRVRLEPPGVRAFDVFVLHLKSKRDGEQAHVIRMGEATAARTLLDQLLGEDPQARFVLCGDFNDTFESEPVRILVGNGPTALRCFFTDLPEDQRITFNKEPYRSMIDFILCSPAMAERYQPGSYRVHPGAVESSGSDHNPVAARFDLR